MLACESFDGEHVGDKPDLSGSSSLFCLSG